MKLFAKINEEYLSIKVYIYVFGSCHIFKKLWLTKKLSVEHLEKQVKQVFQKVR